MFTYETENSKKQIVLCYTLLKKYGLFPRERFFDTPHPLQSILYMDFRHGYN